MTYGRLEIDKDGARHMLASARFAEKRVERVVATTDRLIRRHLTIGLYTMLF